MAGEPESRAAMQGMNNAFACIVFRVLVIFIRAKIGDSEEIRKRRGYIFFSAKYMMAL
jgi:hypothetical protein